MQQEQQESGKELSKGDRHLQWDAVSTIRSLQAAGDQAALVSTIATRAGAVVLLISLVQILTTAYRYHLRLAELWKGRAYALRIVAKGLADLPTAARLMWAEPMDPPSGIDPTALLLRAVSELLKSGNKQ